MKLETERLVLIPLTLDHLRLAITDRSRMASELGLDNDVESLNETMKNVYGIKIENIEKDPDNYLFYTYWQLVHKDDNKIVGEIGFKGMPKDNGQIEVGYGTEKEYRSRGYMIEALKELVRWAFSQEIVAVRTIIACTDKGNIPSHRVLEKAGMRVYVEDDRYLYWKVENIKIRKD
ncbi:MAG: hypothetical protein HPY66_2740 [Firmicutes bacterium]|nr:hypothetical protein [Bacillota bacterium]MDI6706102.1 GNAT family N-acetyltransferase [Bacillota bacterium]